MEPKICASCVGLERCNKYCVLQAGTNLVEFIKGIDIIETQIGEFREDHKTGKMTYIVSGHMLESSGSPTYILSDLSTGIDVSGKFRDFDGLTPQQTLTAYLENLDMKGKLRENSLATFKKFNTNKLLPVPLKPGAECEVTYKEPSGRITVTTTKVKAIKWKSDKKTGKLDCKITCEIEKGTFENNVRILSIPISEYGESIKMPQIERTLKSSETDREIIKMTSVGFIKPIEVTDDKFKLAIDSQHLYRIEDDKIFIIGSWKSGKLVAFQGGIEPVQKSKAYKKINNAINYIERHKRFIVPYGLFEVNEIDLR